VYSTVVHNVRRLLWPVAMVKTTHKLVTVDVFLFVELTLSFL
jgi:hypothetical protein